MAKNRISIDSFLYSNWKEQLLNPNYSLFTDTAAYYLAYLPNEADAQRYEIVKPDYSQVNEKRSTFYWHASEAPFNAMHYKPVLNSQNYRYSHFVRSEGFVKSFAASTRDTIAASSIYQGDTSLRAQLSLLISTNNNNINEKQIQINNVLLGKDLATNNQIARPVYNIRIEDQGPKCGFHR